MKEGERKGDNEEVVIPQQAHDGERGMKRSASERGRSGGLVTTEGRGMEWMDEK